MDTQVRKIVLLLMLLFLSAVAPNLFVMAQKGIAPLSSLAAGFLIPSIVFIAIILVISRILKYSDIVRLTLNGIVAGLIATIALEIFRESGFRLGTMPGQLPRLMGVLILDQFASGPDLGSDIAGWAYHFWNGAAFGIIFSLLFGQSKTNPALYCR